MMTFNPKKSERKILVEFEEKGGFLALQRVVEKLLACICWKLLIWSMMWPMGIFFFKVVGRKI